MQVLLTLISLLRFAPQPASPEGQSCRVPAASADEDRPNHPRRRDTCDWLFDINRASLVANVESGLLEKPLARTIAAALGGQKAD